MSPTSVVIRAIGVEAFRRNVTKIGGVVAVVEEWLCLWHVVSFWDERLRLEILWFLAE